MKFWKDAAVYIGILLFFIVLSYAYVPDVLSGKIVNQSDIAGWKGMAQETMEWNSSHPDDKALWTDSMFGGMPNATMYDEFQGDYTKFLYKALLWGSRPAIYFLIALVGAFLMMLSMGVNRFIAVAGAIAVAFCSYNMQIIQVGHNTKMQAIAFAPWAIAAFIFTYRQAFRTYAQIPGDGISHRRMLSVSLGAVLFGLALSMQIKANHVQITYYLAIILFIYALATFIWVMLKPNRHHLPSFLKASALLLVLGLIGIGTNANKLMPIASYAPFTMRGGSELEGDVNANAQGLSIDYATAWSYGIEETPNLLIPNFNGGSSSGSLPEDSATGELFRKAGQNPKSICSALPLYWGPQPFTAGPMYIGAISIFLFLLGLFILDGREKWWLLACTVLAVLLAWGSHFLWFTRLWFDYAPMYSKFRTVSMALVILQFCVPLLGIYTLDRIVKEEIPHRRVVRGVWWSFGLTAGFCLLTALFPSIAGDFSAASDSRMHEIVADALKADRRHLLQVDAIRSFILITLAAGSIMFSYLKPDPFVAKGRICIASGLIAVLVLFDLWSVGKRYLNSDDFITPGKFSSQFEERVVDKEILADKGLSYRVLDLSVSTFNSSVTSYHHKSIGGYSPTKMQRYQDLIDHYLSDEIQDFHTAIKGAKTLEEIQIAVPYMSVMSMLNTRYIIIGADYPPVLNHFAFGSAWLVDGVKVCDNADEELAALKKTDLLHVAVVRASNDPSNLRFAAPKDLDGISMLGAGGTSAASSETVSPSASGSVEITSYAPNELHYRYSVDRPCVAVFSEIYHPAWKATIIPDAGEQTPERQSLELFTSDWVLRAAKLPSGSGEIVMRYEPQEYVTGRILSQACSSILLILLVLGLAMESVIIIKH